MFLAPNEPLQPRHGHRIVRLLRRWSAARRGEGCQLSGFVAFAGTIGVEPVPAVAIASLFQLTEACLDRPLVAECCCSRRLSRDERAVLLMLSATPSSHPHQSFPPIPHGLPAALLWSIESVRTLTGEFAASDSIRPARCPFSRADRPPVA